MGLFSSIKKVIGKIINFVKAPFRKKRENVAAKVIGTATTSTKTVLVSVGTKIRTKMAERCNLVINRLREKEIAAIQQRIVVLEGELSASKCDYERSTITIRLEHARSKLDRLIGQL